jgi:hypothetical protein
MIEIVSVIGNRCVDVEWVIEQTDKVAVPSLALRMTGIPDGDGQRKADLRLRLRDD